VKPGLTLVLTALLLTGFYMGWQWVAHSPGLPGGQDAVVLSIEQPLSPLSAPQPGGKTIRIAAIGPQTGLPAGVDSTIYSAARFAIRRLNERGGIHGTPVELLEFDSKSTPLGARSAAEQAVAAGAVAVVGGWYSSNARAIAETLQKAGIPMISIGASHPNVTQTGDFIFRVNYIDSFQGAALARFAYETLGARRAVVLTNVGSSYSPYLSDVFTEQFGQFGGAVLWRGEYLPDADHFEFLIQGLAQYPADLIFLPGYEKDSAHIVLEARASGITTPFLGADGWLTSMFQFGGEAVQGSYYAKAWHPQAGLASGLQEEYEAWVAEHGPVVRDMTLLTLDACHVLATAMENAETLTPQSIRDSLAALSEVEGLTGTYSFNAVGDPNKPLVILRLTGPEPELVQVMYPETLRVAVIFAKTGDAAVVNVMGFEAARYAAEEINARGGVLSRQIELIEYDNESTALGSRLAAEQAVRDGVSVAIGASWSSHSTAMAPVFQKAGIPMISPASTNPGVTLAGDCIFRVCFTDRLQGQVMAEFALKDLKAKSAAVLTNANSEYSVDLAKYFIERFRLGGQVLLEQDYLQDTADFEAALQKIKGLNPDVVFVPGYHRDSGFILRQARQMGIQAVFLGGDGWDDLMYEYAREEDLQGCYFSEHWHIDLPDPRSREFVERYSRDHRLYRTGLVALTYDSVYLVADAVKRARSTEARAIRDELARTRDFQGLTGRITFDQNGDTIKQAVILRFDRGQAAFHKVFEIAAD
jgi:branched-chain amino acid transport system substrate-binding protein